ncbi:MAG: Gfo/Idh/MocA family protein, partial [Fimbriimonadaceae bacterium]
MIRFGIVGCGAIFATHADALKKSTNARLTAVYDCEPDKTLVAAEQYSVKSAESIAELFDETDAVTVCVPSGLHAQIGVEAAKAGKHVLVEKPIDISEANAARLIEACRDNGVKLGVISQHRFARDVQKTREAVQYGELGKPLHGNAYIRWYRTQAYYDSAEWRGTWELDGGGCTINQSIHMIDQLQWVMGGVRSVAAQMETVAHEIEVEDTMNALVEFRNGASGVIQSTTAAYPGFKERLEFGGLYGSVILEGDTIKFWEADPEAPANPSPYGRNLKYHPLPTASIFETMNQSKGQDPTVRWENQHRMQIEN